MSSSSQERHLALDCLGIVVNFLSSSKTLLKVLDLSKSVQWYLNFENPFACENVNFRVSQKAMKIIKSEKRYVISLDVFVTAFPHLSYFPNLRSLNLVVRNCCTIRRTIKVPKKRCRCFSKKRIQETRKLLIKSNSPKLNLQKVDIDFRWEKVITDPIMASFSSVKSFCYIGAGITDSGLVHLSQVTELNLSCSTRIMGRNFAKTLVELKLGCSSNMKDASFRHLVELKVLDVGYTDIGDEALFYLKKIEHLECANCQNITDRGLRALPKSLKVFYISNNKNITNEGLLALDFVEELGEILSNDNITEEVLNSFSKLKIATSFGGPKLTNAGMKFLSKVEEIGITRNSSITCYGLKFLRKDLKTLNLYHVSGITSEGLKHFQKIETVSFWNVNNIDDSALKCLEKCKNVTIAMEECKSKFTDDGLKQLKNVRHLFLGHLPDITDECFMGFPNLQSITLNGMDKITDKGMKILSKKELSSVKVSRCRKVTERGIKFLNYPNVERVEFVKFREKKK